MGQKVHPIGFRLSVSQNKKSTPWFSSLKSYSKVIKLNYFIRNFFESRFRLAISDVRVYRNLDNILIYILANNADEIINEQENLLELSYKVLKKSFLKNKKFKIILVQNSQNSLNAQFVSNFIATEIEKRVNHRAAMLQGLRIAKNEMGAEGVKIVISGRFNGQDRGSSQWVKEGSIPLQTLNIPILYSEQVAHTIYGVLGIKVWLSYK